MRLVHGESDGLPGVIADRYDDVIVLQCPSAGAERWRDALAQALAALPGVRCVFERSDAEVRALEGLPPRVGRASPARCPTPVIVHEDGLRYRVDPVAGQKTGFYLDQRDNRRLVRDLARDRRVLNAFCYSGGFTLAALAGGARERAVDRHLRGCAGARTRECRAQSGAPGGAQHVASKPTRSPTCGALRNEGAAFDLIVLDPPKFAPTAAHAERAARAYKDINLLALKMLAPGRPARDVLVLGRHFARPVPEDRRRRGGRRECATRRSCAGSPRARIIRWRSTFRRGNT